jgi:hypothetical protein
VKDLEQILSNRTVLSADQVDRINARLAAFVKSNYGKKEIMLRSTSIAAIGLAMRLYLLHIMYKLDVAVPEKSDGTKPTGDPRMVPVLAISCVKDRKAAIPFNRRYWRDENRETRVTVERLRSTRS